MTNLLSIAAVALATPAAAQHIDCTATQQCRGDAVAMCADSTLSIRVKPHSGNTDHLWIDHQGPYAATRRTDGDLTRWQLGVFGGGYTLDLRPDGVFTYHGNRGKRFSGSCTEMS